MVMGVAKSFVLFSRVGVIVMPKNQIDKVNKFVGRKYSRIVLQHFNMLNLRLYM